MNAVLKLMQAKGLTKKAAEKLLPKAERDENLKKFLEPSAVQMRLYHGTMATEGGKGQEAIRQLRPSKQGALGSGVYMTPKTAMADEYTFSSNPSDQGGNILPLYAQIKNPLILNGSVSRDPMIEALVKLGLDEGKASRMVERAYESKGYIGKEVESRARAQGYDGLMQYDRDGTLGEVVSYNPSAIKSALGNEGTYDTSTPLLNKAEGGLIRMQDGGGEIKASPQNKYIGAVADALKAAQGIAGKYQVDPRIPLLGGMGVDELLGLPGAESLVRDVSYYGPKAAIKGGNVATGGLGTFTLDPRVVDVAGVAETGALATQAAKGLGRAAGRQLQQQITQTPMQSQMGAVNITAPVSKLGFYDPVEEAGLNLKRKQGPGQAFLNELQRAENVNKQFLEQSGIAERLRSAPNITREEVQAMTKGAVPQVEQVVLGSNVVPPSVTEFAKIHLPDFNPSDKDSIAKLIQVADQRYQKAMADGDLDIAEFAEQAETEAKKLARQYEKGDKPAERLSRFAEWQLPGGKNYREVLLKVPVNKLEITETGLPKGYSLKYAPENWMDMTLSGYKVIGPDGNEVDLGPGIFDTEEDAKEALIRGLESGSVNGKDFRTHHWIHDPNVVSHIRMNDRTDYNGNKVLFIEEIQSDWAQQGRKRGFGKDIPEGPFVKNTNEWVDLTLKNIIKRAVDEGYDRVAFINGKQSADRYNLARYVDNIHWESNPLGVNMPKGAEKVAALFMKDYGYIELPISPEGIVVGAKGSQFNGKRLDEIVGRDVANKIMAGDSGSLEGDGLAIGGKGMKDFYDKIVPDRLRKMVGKDKVKHIPGAYRGDIPEPLIDYDVRLDKYEVFDSKSGERMGLFDTASDAKDFIAKIESIPVPPQLGFDITPEIREKFSQPIPYKHGGVVKMAAGGADKFLKRGIDRVVKHKDPPTTKIQEWQWRPLAEVNQQLKLAEVPDYIQRGYGDFMIEQAKRAASGNLGVRDLIKAYGITQSSIGRGGLSYETATKAGLKVPKGEGLVRPEGAFAEWLGSKQGQKFLDDAERGVVNEKALDDIRVKFAPFGKANQLTEQLRYGVNNMSTLVPQMQKALVGPADEYRDWAESMKGIAGAKSGFIGSMLGRGDLPTLDARQLNLHALEAPVAPQTMMQRGKGLGAREAVDRLAARQSALGLDIDPSLDPYYQHLAHHAVWDKVANEKTTHDDLMRALRGYKQGGTPDTDAMRLEMMRKSWRSK